MSEHESYQTNFFQAWGKGSFVSIYNVVKFKSAGRDTIISLLFSFPSKSFELLTMGFSHGVVLHMRAKELVGK